MLLFCALPVSTCFSQELDCNVQISTQQVAISDKSLFDDMQKAIFEFMNNTKWTSDVYATEERIECSMFFNITQRIGTNEFKATLQVQSRRPVFGTSYNTTLLNHNDNDIRFKYLQFDQLQFSENSYISELTTILAFYAYVIIGLDYDSFSPKGGTTHFQKALSIINTAQGSPYQGWKAYEGQKNRYWFINNHMDEVFKPLRDCYYIYHRLGFDAMSEKIIEGRKAITEALENLQQVHTSKPVSYNMQIFFSAKSDEMVNLYSKSDDTQEKIKVVNILKRIDPHNTTKYQKILTSK